LPVRPRRTRKNEVRTAISSVRTIARGVRHLAPDREVSHRKDAKMKRYAKAIMTSAAAEQDGSAPTGAKHHDAVPMAV
jgi:hypothetical protein